MVLCETDYPFFCYDFVVPHEPDKAYYNSSVGTITETSNAMFCASFNNAGQVFYEMGNNSNCFAYYDQVVLLSYVFSFVSRYPGYNPLSFSEFDILRYDHTSEDSTWVYYFQ